jgi:hypothetical protein
MIPLDTRNIGYRISFLAPNFSYFSYLFCYIINITFHDKITISHLHVIIMARIHQSSTNTKRDRKEYDRKKTEEAREYNKDETHVDRQCLSCWRKKGNSDFAYIDEHRKRKGYTSACLSCRNINAGSRRKCHRPRNILFKKIIDKAKAGGCSIETCTEQHVLEFDHLKDGDKSFLINSRGYQHLHVKSKTEKQAIDELHAEIEKCQIMCRFHHRIKSQKQRYEYGQRNRLAEDAGTKKQQTRRRSERKRHENRRQYVINIKIALGCCANVSCDKRVTRENVFGFDFDHINRSEKYKCIGVLVGKGASIEVIDAEISKCNLLCANCHHMKTIKEDVARYKI